MVEIDGIRVDVAALLRIRHACDPHLCKAGQCCCRHYEISFTGRELARAVGLMPQCRNYAPHLQEGAEFDNPFEKAERNLWTADEQEDGTCAFAFTDTDGATWCSLHAAALDLGLSPWKVKPEPCMLWPLALSDDRPRVLGLHDDLLRFPCNKRRRGTPKTLDHGIAECIERVLGATFLENLQAHIRQTR